MLTLFIFVCFDEMIYRSSKGGNDDKDTCNENTYNSIGNCSLYFLSVNVLNKFLRDQDI